LGSVRLSIFDLTAAGHQPMQARDGAAWLVYNGAVFNFPEIRRELIDLGCPIASHCDTEVVLWSLLTWGLPALDRFNGMWALAFWDSQTGELLCARDRFGIKPFYYAWRGRRFVFASEPASILAHDGRGHGPNAEAVSKFLAHGHMPATDSTFFADILQLPPGNVLRVGLDGRISRTRWWHPRVRALPTLDAYVEAVRGLVVDAVRLRLRSDVPVGACLSGGLDSSSIVSLVARITADDCPATVRAFTVRFPDPGCDEIEYARLVASRSGAHLDVVEPRVDWLQSGDLLRLVRCQGEPFPSLSVFAQFCVFRRMREAGVTVALDGQGADELFWGYPWHGAALAASCLRRGDVRGFLSAATSAVAMQGASRLGTGLLGLPYYNLPRLRLLRDLLSRSGGPLSARVSLAFDLFSHPSVADTPHTLRIREIESEPLPAMLRYEDRNSMAFSIESRLPFLDHRLVELVLSCPEDKLLARGWSKYLLRQSMRGYLPEQIRWRRTKLGFAAPTERLTRDARALLLDLLPTFSPSAQFVNLVRLRRQLQRDATMPPWVWRALSVVLWMNEFSLLGT
jgi:asparagine synthase (glutamine-hydrolysing)